MDEWRWCCLAPKVERCLPEPDEFSSCEDLMSNLVLRVCIWTLGFIALVGNTFVIIWRSLYSSGNKMHSFLIVNLALGDFMMGVYLIIIAAVDMRYRGVYAAYERQWRSSGLCQLAGFISTFSSELSVFTLTVITVDRLIVIKFPFGVKRLDGRATRSVMVGVWMLVGTLATIPLFPLRYFSNFYGRSGVCLALHITNEKPSGWEYSVLIYLVLNMVSFGVIAASYALMYIIARDTHTAARNGPEQVMTGWRDVGMARRMTLIVATDALCWLPIIFLGIASLAGVTIPPKVFSWIAVFVLPLNAAVNPILYTLSTAPVRSHLRGLQRAVSKEPRDGLSLSTRAASIRSVTKSSMKVRKFSDVSLIALTKYSMKARKFSDVSDIPVMESTDIKTEENCIHIYTTTKCDHNVSSLANFQSNVYKDPIQVINGGSLHLNHNIQGCNKELKDEVVLTEHVSLFLQQSPESSSGTSCTAAELQEQHPDMELVPLSDLTDASEHRRSSKRKQRRKNQDLRYD